MLFLNLILISMTDIIKNGNEFYRNGKYEDALNEYLKIDKRNPFLYYNIGNCYYRLEKKGYALLYYKKAYFLAPRDRDIRNNIEIIEGKRKFENPILALSYTFINLFSLNESFLIFTTFYGAGSILLTLFFIKRKTSFLVISIILIFISILFLPSVIYWITRINSNECVIVENTIGRSGPGDNFQEIVEFNEGTSGKILKKDNEWILFTSGKEIAWVKENIELINKK